MRHRLLALLVSAALCAGAAAAAPKDDMIAADQAFSAMSAAKGAHAAFLAFMTDDVRLYDGGHPPIVGKAAAAAYYAAEEKKNPDDGLTSLTWTPLEAEASADGSLGWTRGTWVWTSKKKGKGPQQLTGYYVTEWRRQADGHYKFCLDIGGADRQ